MGSKMPTPPEPTHGASIDDHAADRDCMSQDELRTQFSIDPQRQVRLVKLLFMQYQHPDLDQITIFLQDFGLTVVKSTPESRWFGGYGSEPFVYYARKGPRKFGGGAFLVETYADLEKAMKVKGVKVLSNGIEKLDEAPGGGYIVTLEDPEGFPISLVHGQQQEQAPVELPTPITLNYEVKKPRVRQFQRFTQGPAAVYRLGHYGLVVGDFKAQFKFYTQNFNIMPTSILYLENGADKTKGTKSGQRQDVAMFAHIERGSELVDHHSLFLVSRPPHIKESHVHHCSFEVHDFDTQLIGHDWMLKQKYRPAWGVGRHILGSQIFDYWWDPNGFMVEHYIDGDVVNENTPVSYHPAASAKDAAWGPDVPMEFLE